MSCASCAARIENGLAEVAGVAAAQVNFAARRAHVDFDPQVVSERQLQAQIQRLGFGATPGRRQQQEQDPPFTAGPALAAMIALAAASMVVSSLDALRFGGWQWLVGALSVPVVLVGGSAFHRPGWRALQQRHATMDTLVSLGSLVAWGWSAVVTIGGFDAHVYFDTAAVIVAVVLLGRRLEARARRRAGDAIGALVALNIGSVRLTDGRDVPPEDVAVGMHFLVRPGERIAADGVVIEGRSAVDTSIMTGEPVPVEAGPGDEVTGGALNTDGSLVVAASRVGADGTLAQIVRLVEEALGRKAPIQRLADRIAAVFVPVVVVAALATLAGWLLVGPAGVAISAAVAVLIVACPCALGLATPAAFLAGSGRGAQLGVIIRGPDALEAARDVDVVALDKTGTVTEGRLEVVAAETVAGVSEAELLATAALLEARSEHPVAAAVLRAAGTDAGADPDSPDTDPALHPTLGPVAAPIPDDRPAPRRPDAAADRSGGDSVVGQVELRSDGRAAVSDFRNLPGFGVQGRVPRPAHRSRRDAGSDAGSGAGPGDDDGDDSDAPERDRILANPDGTLVSVGRRELFDVVAEDLAAAADRHAAEGRTLVFVGSDGVAEGFLALADRVKPTSAAAVAAWQAGGTEVVLLSGDNTPAAEQVAREVGITRVLAELTPAEKATEIQRLQAAGHRVAMVGDGVNDAPALAAADLGVAIGTGADVAAEASDLTLVGDDLRAAVDALALARRTLATIRGNLFWAFAYNTAAIPLAAAGLLRPEIAAGAMGLSSLFVLGNSLRLSGFRGLRTAS